MSRRVTGCHSPSRLGVVIITIQNLKGDASGLLKLRFPKISTSYRRNRSGFFQWYVIFSFSRYISTRRL
ncbi:hypothetical protein GCZ13_06130 [Escherichia coli]|nr:hypothetical protein [Escherichia coli]EFF1816193.1 hypothetical protein [Escherichia coli]